MNAIEFNTQIHDGIVEIPSQYTSWQNKKVRVILLESEEPLATPPPLKFNAVSLETKNYHFDREQANER